MPFNTGDVSIAANAITVELDLEKDGNYQVACVNTFSEALNYNSEEWYDFCSKGFSSNAVTGMSPEWSGEMVIRFGEFSSDFAKKRYDITAINNVPMRITNALLEEVVMINVSLTDFSMDMVAEELLKASFTVKPFQGAPVVLQYNPPAIPTALAVTPASITDTGATITWTKTPNTTTNVYLNGALTAQNLTVETYTFTGLNPSTQYSVTIKAVSVDGFKSDATAPVTFATIAPIV